jgi:methylmalonyl-CoA mutase
VKPDFAHIDFRTGITGNDDADSKGIRSDHEWFTAEQIPVKTVFTREDLEGLEHLDYAAGLPPYLRGPYSAM